MSSSPRPLARGLLVRRSVVVWLSLVGTPLAGCVGSVVDPKGEQEDAGGKPNLPEDDHDQRQEYVLPACPDGQPRPLARGLRIREVALYQTVKIPLFRDGSWLENRTAPIVRDKRALVRVFVEPLAGYEPHEVYAVLRARSSDETRELADPRTLRVASRDAELTSTFNIDLPRDLVDENPELSISLEEPDCSTTGGEASDARAPAAGAKALDAESIGVLRVKLVPLVVGGRVPKISKESLAGTRSMLRALFPVPDVEVTVREPFEIHVEGKLVNEEKPWLVLNSHMIGLRQRDKPPADVYYVGLVSPGASRAAYCSGGCRLGIAPLAKENQVDSRVASVAFFADDTSYESLAHELGHAHGLSHVSCRGIEDSADPNFPDPTGNIGDWGWNARRGTLTPPTTKDIMGYCEPVWIGAYNYRALAERAKSANVSALMQEGVAGGFRDLLVEGDGTVRWNGEAPRNALAGTREPAIVRDAAGAEVARIELGVIPLSHAEAVMVSIPAPGARWSTISRSRGMIALSDVLPPY